MKNLPLHKIHKAFGAKIISFAGYNMPIQYEGVISEHLTVRKAVGVFDVSHMGEFLIEGNTALDLIQKITSNDASKLEIGDAQYCYFPNENNGIVDDLICYRVKENTYLLVVNAANIDKDWSWVSKHNEEFGAELKNLSEHYSLLAIQGPKAVEAAQSLSSLNLYEIPFYKFKIGDFAGIEYVIISATGYTGSGGFEIFCKNSEVEQIWDKVFEAGKEFGIKPIGLAARDTLRIEMGYCLYGNEINDTTSPFEAGLGWVTKFNKKFVNHKALAEQQKQKLEHKLVAFEIVRKGIPRSGYTIANKENNKIGNVTSGTMSPSLNKGIGLGYVPIKYAKLGAEIYIIIRKNPVLAKIIKPPFYKG